MPIAPATQALANVQAAEQRRKLLAQRLAAQMAARQSATGRQQSVGRSFGNSVDLRSGLAPAFSLGLGVDVAPGRERPAGFDPGAPATIPSAPPAGGGVGVGASDPTIPTPPVGGAPGQTDTRPFVGHAPAAPGGFNSDTPLTYTPPPAPVTPLTNAYPRFSGGFNGVYTPPDPYTVMINLLQQHQALYGGVV